MHKSRREERRRHEQRREEKRREEETRGEKRREERRTEQSRAEQSSVRSGKRRHNSRSNEENNGIRKWQREKAAVCHLSHKQIVLSPSRPAPDCILQAEGLNGGKSNLPGAE